MAEPFVSEIRIMSFNFAPRGWAMCNGQLMPINQNQALFSLLGTTFGGDGRVNLRAARPPRACADPRHSSHTLGERGGEQAHTVSTNELPTHTHALNGSSRTPTSSRRGAHRGRASRQPHGAEERATAPVSQHNRDGGYNFAGKGGRSGIDDTAAALQALVAAGKRGSRTVSRAASFLAAQQNADGGMALTPGQASNAQSTAWAIQGLAAAGRSPARLNRRGGRSPLQYLRSLRSSSGAVRYSRSSTQTPVWVTAQALTGFRMKPFPLR